MVARTKILLGCGLSIAALFFPFPPLVREALSQESQASATPLKDVCPEGWSRYVCDNTLRLCVSPEVEKQYDLSNSYREFSQERCSVDSMSVPEAWTHATQEEMGYLAPDNGKYRGYQPHRVGVVNLDSSQIKNGDLKSAILRVTPTSEDLRSYEKGFSKYIARYEISVDSYNIQSRPRAGDDGQPSQR